ncbi:Ark- serine/threonine protein kinase, variant 2 [Stygiomarasmius scandens]
MMLREHGTQRPTVFELLAHVHRLRGTKSQFHYTIPSPQPLSPRTQSQFKPSPSPSHLENTISYRQAPSVASSVISNPNPPVNAGIQARDKVLEAIAPMRRGRPVPSKESSLSRPASPERGPSDSRSAAKGKNWLDDEEQAWEAIASKTAKKVAKHDDDAWGLPSDNNAKAKKVGQGFNDDFGEQLWKASDPNAEPKGPSALSESKFSSTRPPLTTRISDVPPKSSSATRVKEKDAFDGLGLSLNEKAPPTLAEARKLRTGLALMTPNVPRTHSPGWNDSNKQGAPSTQSPSPRPPYTSQPQSLSLPAASALQPSSSGSSWSSQPPASRPSSSHQTTSASAESRFPSLEELDATFSPSPGRSHLSVPTKAGPHAASQPSLSKLSDTTTTSYKSSNLGRRPSRSGAPPIGSSGTDGTRSEQITGIAMRAGASTPGPHLTSSDRSDSNPALTRGSSIRRHRSSLSMKPTSPKSEEPPIPIRPSMQETSSSSQRDWLTGDDNISDVPPPPSPRSANGPVLRDSPSKRASYIQKSTIQFQQAIPVTHERAPSPSRSNTLSIPASQPSVEPDSPSARAQRVFPELDTVLEPVRSLTDNWSPIETKSTSGSKHDDSVSSPDEEGPEEAGRHVPHASGNNASSYRQKGHKGRQSSVHDLVDLWGGGVTKDKDLTKSTVTPAPKSAGLEKRRSIASRPPRRNSVSPQPPTPSGNSSMISSPPLSSPSSSTSSRSRPQSMFIFPSKSVDNPAPPSAGFNSIQPEPRSPAPTSLSPPSDSQPRRGRRTSITDMVQRYEAIDAVARGSMPSKPAPLRVSNLPTTPTTENPPPRSPVTKRTLQSNGKTPSTLGYGNADDKGPKVQRSVSSGLPKPSISGLPRRTSPAPAEPDNFQGEEPPVRSRHISNKLESTSSFPSRKLTTEDVPSPKDKDTSPERPYQGVGRLIDQWQRKTAETESTRTPIPSKRGGFVTKRAGIVNSGTSQ